MVGILKSNFLLFPALALCVLLYAFIPDQDPRPPRFLSSKSNQRLVECELLSCPVQVGENKKYNLARARLFLVENEDGLVSSADGETSLYFPSELCEIYQPGRLYSAWRGKKVDFLLDKGARCVLLASEKSFFDKKSSLEKKSFYVSELLSCSFKDTFWGRLQRLRALSRLLFARLMFAWGSAGGLLLALLSGSRSYLESDSARAFRLSGLSHVLALSGMHLSLFSSLAFAFGKKTFGKKAAPYLELFAISVFVWFAGKSPSLFRALLCSFAAIFSGLLKIKAKSPLNLLALVFLIHVCVFPRDIRELSFMLSYGSLAGILAFNEFIAKPLFGAIPSGAANSLAQSLGAQSVSMPICARFFGFLTPAGILASVFVSPMVTIFIYLGLFCILASLLFPFAAPLCGCLLSFVYKGIKGSVLFFSAIPCLKI